MLPSGTCSSRPTDPQELPKDCPNRHQIHCAIWRIPSQAVIGGRPAPGRQSSPCAFPMPKITFIGSDGTSYSVEGEPGSTVMETAIKNNVPGIEAECGGACACATCHVYVEETWRARTGDASPMEEDMLGFGYDVRTNSRLSCQIKVSDELDGLVVRVPERQA